MFSKENQGVPFPIGMETQLLMGWDTKPSLLYAHGWELTVPALFLVNKVKKETQLQLWDM